MRNFQPLKLPAHGSRTHFAEISAKAGASALILEIGCGVGWHPVSHAKANPKSLIIAIEHTADKFKRFEGRIKKHQLPNLIGIHANAVSWVSQELPPQSLDHIFLLYPNPNPKNASKRWFRMPFMHQLLLCLKAGGRLSLASNLRPYLDEAIELGVKTWGLNLISDQVLDAEQAPRTHFEKKYLNRGESCWNVEFQK